MNDLQNRLTNTASSNLEAPGEGGEQSGRPKMVQGSLLQREFLAWVACTPRTYAETMDAWRTSCPRQSIWEDTLAEGLVLLEHKPGTVMRQAEVRLSSTGRAVLNASCCHNDIDA